MANHPNRAKIEPQPTPAYLLDAASDLVKHAAKLLEGGTPEETEIVRKRALNTARRAIKSLQLMAPPAAEAAE